MPLGRVEDEGRDVVAIRVTAVRFTCPAGHEWVLTVVEIQAMQDDPEACPECGESAVDAGIADQSRTLERRGVVVRIPRD